MRNFVTQQEFEEYWFGRAGLEKPAGYRASDKAFFVYFTATWCGPCKRLDLDKIEAAAKAVGIPLWKCEQTENDYTAGYCDVRSLPTFLLLQPKTIVGRLSSSSTDTIVDWMKGFKK
jgi:thiol-disulfide isomerase/thioredoxin